MGFVYTQTEPGILWFSLRENEGAGRDLTVLPARWDPLACVHVTLWYQNGASIEHEVFVTVGLNKCREKRGLPADGRLLLSPVAQVIWINCMVVG